MLCNLLHFSRPNDDHTICYKAVIAQVETRCSISPTPIPLPHCIPPLIGMAGRIMVLVPAALMVSIMLVAFILSLNLATKPVAVVMSPFAFINIRRSAILSASWSTAAVITLRSAVLRKYIFRHGYGAGISLYLRLILCFILALKHPRWPAEVACTWKPVWSV